MNSSLVLAADGYSVFENEFQTAVQPSTARLASGWYAGRCYTTKNTEIEKAGLLVLMPGKSKNDGTGGVKILVPGASIDLPSDKYDQLNPVDYEDYRELLFAAQNDVAREENSSLVAELSYDQGLLGTLHLREMATGGLILAMTNFEDAPRTEKNALFYCRFTKKVHDLDPADIK